MAFQSFKSIVFFFLFQVQVQGAIGANDSIGVHLEPSHDTFIRRDKGDVLYGDASKITVTKKGSNQRIGLMKFDTTEYGINADKTDATLRLTVADTHQKPVEVRVYRMVNDFHEDHLTWDTFDGDVHSDQTVTFTVKKSHTGQPGEIDVSSLLRTGEDMVLAFIVDEGHVKFHSKDNDYDLTPKLVLTPRKSEL